MSRLSCPLRHQKLVVNRTGSISIDTSAVALRAKRVRSASRMRPTSGGGTSDGVPPPKNTLDSGAAPAAVCTRVVDRPDPCAQMRQRVSII